MPYPRARKQRNDTKISQRYLLWMIIVFIFRVYRTDQYLQNVPVLWKTTKKISTPSLLSEVWLSVAHQPPYKAITLISSRVSFFSILQVKYLNCILRVFLSTECSRNSWVRPNGLASNQKAYSLCMRWQMRYSWEITISRTTCCDSVQPKYVSKHGKFPSWERSVA